MASPLELDTGGRDIGLTAAPLTPSAFAPFGDVIENPRPDVHPSRYRQGLPFDAVPANQSTAIKYQHVTRPANLYAEAPSGGPGVAVINMFACAAQAPGPGGRLAALRVLERHPFTAQTFVPLTADPRSRYLVVVAPSLAPAPADAGLPVPRAAGLPGRGLPDLPALRAFVATAEQAVTYGPGTWHAPMLALGRQGTAVDFVVSQFASGVAIEDCQEVLLAPPPAGEGAVGAAGGVVVRIPDMAAAVARL